MRAIRPIAVSALFASFVATQAVAGGLDIVVEEPVIIPIEVVEPAGSSYGFIIPLVALAALAALALSEQ